MISCHSELDVQTNFFELVHNFLIYVYKKKNILIEFLNTLCKWL